MKKILLTLVVVLLMCPMTFAASKTLTVQWTCNTETDLAGYTLWTYIPGTSTTPTITTDIPKVTGMVCEKTIPITVPDNAVTQVCVDMDAYDTNNNHSVHSTKPCRSVDALAPGAPTGVVITITTP